MVPKMYSRDGCVTCKTRRKKCDEVRPACGACVRMKLSCSYTRKSGPKKIKIAPSFISTPESNESIESSNESTELTISGSSVSPSTSPATSISLTNSTCGHFQLLDSLDYRAFQLTICESFVINACELGWNHDLVEADRLSTVTIKAPLSLTSIDESSASRTAWHAYCYYVFGKEHRLPAMLMRSRSLYSEVLTMLYSLDWDGHSVETGMEIIVAATFLTMLEMRASLHSKAWILHNEGVQAIVTRLGPQVFTDPLRLSWFESSRWAFVFVMIIQNKVNLLEDDAWLTIPWSRPGLHGWDQQKPMEQQMLDIILSACKRMRIMMALPSAHERTTFKRIMDEFWLSYGEVRQSASDWSDRHSSRIAVTDWLVHADGSREQELFPHGVPLFATPMATVSVSWYYILLNHINAVTAFICVLMAEFEMSCDEFDLDRLVHWLWVDDPETEQDFLAQLYDPNSRPATSGSASLDHSRTLWLAMADRSLELAREAAVMECSVITPFMNEQSESFFLIMGMIALIPAIHVLRDDPLGHWAREKCLALLGGETFKEIMEMTQGQSMIGF